jgi:hypothetical protein
VLAVELCHSCRHSDVGPSKLLERWRGQSDTAMYREAGSGRDAAGDQRLTDQAGARTFENSTAEDVEMNDVQRRRTREREAGQR